MQNRGGLDDRKDLRSVDDVEELKYLVIFKFRLGVLDLYPRESPPILAESIFPRPGKGGEV